MLFPPSTLILFTQSVPNATLEEVKKLSADVIALHEKCAADELSDPECKKHLVSVWKLNWSTCRRID